MPSAALDNLHNFTLQNRKQFGQALVGIVASQALLRKVSEFVTPRPSTLNPEV